MLPSYQEYLSPIIIMTHIYSVSLSLHRSTTRTTKFSILYYRFTVVVVVVAFITHQQSIIKTNKQRKKEKTPHTTVGEEVSLLEFMNKVNKVL
jgi:hypothetical protein